MAELARERENTGIRRAEVRQWEQRQTAKEGGMFVEDLLGDSQSCEVCITNPLSTRGNPEDQRVK